MRDTYQTRLRHEKRDVAAFIIGQVKSAGGRFLEVNDGVFSLATEERAIEKACQALREKKWENRKPIHLIKSKIKKLSTKEGDKASKKANAELCTSSAPKKASVLSIPSRPLVSHAQPQPKASDTETPTLLHEVEVGTRIEVFWPLDQKYYAAKVKALVGSQAHLQYELDGVCEWLNLSEHNFKAVS